MTRGSVAHSMIATNLVRVLQDRLLGGPCRAFRGDLKIEVAGRVRYPDAMVTCSAVRPDDDIVPDPVVVFEVVSCSAAGTDRIVKNEEYRSTASIRRYVMLEQDRIAATVFARSGDDWVGHVVADATMLALPELGIDVPFAEIYAGVEMVGENSG